MYYDNIDDLTDFEFALDTAGECEAQAEAAMLEDAIARIEEQE